MYFVRLQGCEVGCYFCDTKYTWRKMDLRPEAFIAEDVIAKRAKQSGARWMCITGGEPYEQDLFALVEAAHVNNMPVCVETSGTVWDEKPNVDWITLSPKDLFSKKKTVEEFKKKASEYKCVVTKRSDIDYYIRQYYPYAYAESKPFIIQPVDGNEELAKMALATCTKEGLQGFRIMTQMHKIWNMR